jgi:hypothetical protein
LQPNKPAKTLIVELSRTPKNKKLIARIRQRTADSDVYGINLLARRSLTNIDDARQVINHMMIHPALNNFQVVIELDDDLRAEQEAEAAAAGSVTHG